MAVALGIGVALLGGGGVATADTDATGSPSQAASSQTSSSQVSSDRGTHRSASVSAPRRSVGAAAAVRSAASTHDNAARSATSTATLPAAASPVRAAATAIAPDPQATIATPYGELGKWMINKNGDVADWVGLAYNGKTMQEGINTIFVVQAATERKAEKLLNKSLKQAGFGASCCSSIGYQGIVKTETYQQYPRGGIFGQGVGLIGKLFGIGPAYRDAPFNKPNTHLRTFGGAADGKGNFVFTASVSKETLVKVDGKVTHAYESFDTARTALLDAMLGKGATNLGKVEMGNKIPADDPTYTTGDADGLAQIIGVGPKK